MDDGTLLDRYSRQADEDAFRELVHRHLNFVYSAALRQVGGDAQFAQDVAQIVFTDLARKAAALTSHPVITGWLFTSTRFAAANLVRRERLRQTREEKAHAMQQILGQDEGALRWEEIRPVLDETLAELKAIDRDAVLMRFFEQRPFADIGVALNLTEDAARMRVERAIDKLHALLAKRGVTSTSAALGLALTNQAAASAPAGLAAAVCNAAFTEASTATSAAGWITFMSTSKIPATAAATLALLAVGVASYEGFTCRAATEAALTASNDVTALMARRQQLEKRLLVADGKASELRQRVSEARATEAARAAQARTSAPAATNPPSAADQRAAGQEFMARHPAFKAAVDDNARARVEAQYRSLYRALALTPAQIEQFVSLLMNYESVRLTSEPEMPDVFYPGAGLSREEVERRVRELLGEMGYRQYRDIWGWGWTREWAERLAGMLCFTDAPLSVDQTERLAQTFRAAQNSLKNNNGGSRNYWAYVSGAAREFLSEPQLTIVTQYGQQRLYESEVRARLGLPGSWAGGGTTAATKK